VSGSVVTAIEGNVGILTLNRPEKRNALTMEMRSRLSTYLDEFEKDRRSVW